LVTDIEKATWNNKSDFSGSYNDLTNKPTIPTVPAISTNITSDATSDTKTASPKAVKDFVEGKGYLTQHQDISGKADQTDLEALEDRVETLEQSSGSGSGSGGDITVDVNLSDTSINPVQNKTLYDYLTIEGQGVTGDIASTISLRSIANIPIVYLDANTFDTVMYDNKVIHIIPPLEDYANRTTPNKAYMIYNSEYKIFLWSGRNMDVLLKFMFNYNNEYNYLDIRSGHPTFLMPEAQVGSRVRATTISAKLGDIDPTSVWCVCHEQTNVANQEESYNVHFYINGKEYYYYDSRDNYSDVDVGDYEEDVTVNYIQDSVKTIISLKDKIASLEMLVEELRNNAIIRTNNMWESTIRVPIGGVVLYMGNTTSNYTNGKLYQRTSTGWSLIS
jgi:hypothetical protein